MIRVNLLEGGLFTKNQGDEKDDDRFTFQEISSLSLFDTYPGLKILTMVFPIMALFLYEKKIHYDARKSYSNINAEVASARGIFNKKKTLIETIGKMKAEYKKFLPFKTEFKNIAKEKLFGIQVLDLLQDSLPKEVWLTSFELTREGINIEGNANSDIALNTFEKNLEESSRFKDILIYNAVEKKFSENRIGVEFRMKASLR